MIDAGSLTNLLEKSSYYVYGSNDYMAPEIKSALSQNHNNALKKYLPTLLNPGTVINHNLEKSDIYSYGIMVKLMYPSLFDEEFLNELTHRYPFRRPSAQDILNKLNEEFLGGKKRTKRRRKQRRSKRRRETPFAKE